MSRGVFYEIKGNQKIKRNITTQNGYGLKYESKHHKPI